MTSLTMTADKIGLTFVARWFTKLSAHFAAKSLQRKTIKELSMLSDRELKDIGLHRGLIATKAHSAYKMELVQQLDSDCSCRS